MVSQRQASSASAHHDCRRCSSAKAVRALLASVSWQPRAHRLARVSKPPTRHHVFAAISRATWTRRDRGTYAPSMRCCLASDPPTITPHILITHPVQARPLPIAVTDLSNFHTLYQFPGHYAAASFLELHSCSCFLFLQPWPPTVNIAWPLAPHHHNCPTRKLAIASSLCGNLVATAV